MKCTSADTNGWGILYGSHASGGGCYFRALHMPEEPPALPDPVEDPKPPPVEEPKGELWLCAPKPPAACPNPPPPAGGGTLKPPEAAAGAPKPPPAGGP